MKRNYNDPVYKDWRIKVYKRDRFTCQMPRCKCKKGLQAHHIRRWSAASILRYDVQNGITLCRNCHKKVTGNEQFYESLFMDILKNKHG